MAYLDAAIERRRDSVEAEFGNMVEAVRSGYVFARNKRAYDSWARRRSSSAASDGRGAGRGLAGESLERAISIMSRMHPEYVVVGR